MHVPYNEPALVGWFPSSSHMVFSGNPKNLLVNLCLINDSVVCKSLYFSLGGVLLYKRDHPYITSAEGLGGLGLAIFADTYSLMN